MQITGLATHISYFIMAQILTELLVKFCFLLMPLNKYLKDNRYFDYWEYCFNTISNMVKVPRFQSLLIMLVLSNPWFESNS
jgi:hypothetical protein